MRTSEGSDGSAGGMRPRPVSWVRASGGVRGTAGGGVAGGVLEAAGGVVGEVGTAWCAARASSGRRQETAAPRRETYDVREVSDMLDKGLPRQVALPLFDQLEA